MRGAEKGFLLLTSHLGDPESNPLTVAQFRRLAARVRDMGKPEEDRELTSEDLLKLGYDRQWANRILHLLSREELLEYYVNLAGKSHCYPITRLSTDYPQALYNRLENDTPKSEAKRS